MNHAQKLASLTDSEKFIHSLGKVAHDLDPTILSGDIDKRKFTRLAGKIVADMATGGSDIDFSKIDFKLFISEFNRLNEFLK